MLSDRDFLIELEHYKAVLNGGILLLAAVIGAILFTDKIGDINTGISFIVILFVIMFILAASIRGQFKEN